MPWLRTNARASALLAGLTACTASPTPGGAGDPADAEGPPADERRTDAAPVKPAPAADGGGFVTIGEDAAPASDAATRDSGSGVGSMPSADAAPAPAEGDELPERPLRVDRTSPQLYTFKFKPSEADPAASSRDEVQTAVFDTRAATIRGKLVVTLSGVNNPPGPVGVASYAAGLGFHAYSVAYQNSVNPSTQNDPAFFGAMRLEAFDGMDRTPRITVSRADCVEVRIAKALAYLQAKNPAGDWGYYLKSDGTVRWSDVIFMGHSHGASSAPAYAKVRRVWRAISLSGPRDTRPVTASWLTAPSLTPIDRYYGFTGTGDAQHQDHLKAMEAAGYLGAVVDVGGATPPYNGSHRLKYNGGHGGSASCGTYDAVCKYMLGVQ